MIQEKRNNLIITADDFGKSERANRNILRLAETGKIDRVSVMSNGNFAPGEIERLKASGVKLDIHLDLADVPAREKKLKQGVLKRGLAFLLKHLSSQKYGKQQVERRWAGQIEIFEKLFGHKPAGLNSHQHVHLFGRYFLISQKLLHRFQIPYFRFAKKNLLGSKTNIRRVINLLWKKNAKKIDFDSFDGPDYFASLDWIGNLDDFRKSVPGGKIEIACHPEREEEYNLINKIF